MHNIEINPYLGSPLKKAVDCLAAIGAVIILSPIIIIIAIIIWMTAGRPVLFKQRRVGKQGKQFTIYKFRTMQVGAEKQQKQISSLNEADGPVFKIKNDPRYVGWGRALAWSGLDELPQLGNVFLGQMSLVGPRPLPVNEWIQVKKRYGYRDLVLPGITSWWVVAGSHQLTFEKWMELDKQYLERASAIVDVRIVAMTILIPLRVMFGHKWGSEKLIKATYGNK